MRESLAALVTGVVALIGAAAALIKARTGARKEDADEHVAITQVSFAAAKDVVDLLRGELDRIRADLGRLGEDLRTERATTARLVEELAAEAQRCDQLWRRVEWLGRKLVESGITITGGPPMPHERTHDHPADR